MKIPLNAAICVAFACCCLSSLAADEPGTIAVYDINSPIVESSSASLSLSTLMSGPGGLQMFDLVKALRTAAKDEKLKALVFDIDQAGVGLAQLQELRYHFGKIREAGKDIWLFTESLGNAQAILGSAASEIVLMPEGNVSVSGLYSERMYYRELMDRVGVKANVIHIGDFKSAGETYYLNGPSDASRKQTRELMQSQFDQLVEAIATGRKMESEKVRGMIDEGFMTPEEAKEAGLVDRLLYRTDFVKALKEKYGEESEIDYGYGLPDSEDAEIGSVFDLMKMAMGSGAKKKRRERGEFIDVIVLEGAITDASIAPVRREILRAARDQNCKGVVFRVNSPGGSAMASDVLWEATDELRATGKPLVVSMGGVAASGGYYVSAGADRIFADAGTVTGSIGVVGMKFDISGVLNWAGVRTHREKFGAHADLNTMTRAFSDEEEKLIRESMIDVYGTFKKRITDGRGERIKGELEPLAGGRVYTGKQALKLGLVDELGGLSQAIDFAAEKSGVGEDFKLRLRPEPKSLFEMFGSGGDEEDGEFIRFSHPEEHPGARLRAAVEKQFGLLGLLPDRQRAGVESFLHQLEHLSGTQVWLLAPDFTPSLK